MNSKPELRWQLKSRRQQLSAMEVKDLSEQIVQRCINVIPWKSVKSLHTYVPIAKEKEVDTWGLLKYVWAEQPHIKTAVPYSRNPIHQSSALVTPSTEWLVDGLLMPRPKAAEILQVDYMFDVVIVPMLGFDDRGHRLGYGNGWYDRFLALQDTAMSIGLSYAIGHVATGLPAEPHDVALHYIVSEKNVIKTETTK